MLLSAVLGTMSVTSALAMLPAAAHQTMAAAYQATAAAPRSTAKAVPWAKAGPGWAVVQYSTGTYVAGKPAKAGREILYLVSPQGKKYEFYSWKPSPDVATPSLIGWSGDRQRVLLTSQVTYSDPVTVEQVSLVTGKVIGKFGLPREVEPIGYTRPDGLNLLATNDDSQLVRYALQGHQHKVLGRVNDAVPSVALYTPDGTEIVAAAPKGLEVVSNAGGIVKRLPAPVPGSDCFPIRWWTAGTVLAGCSPKRPGPAPLWLFNVGTGRVKVLTSAKIPVAQDNAWRVGGNLYIQAAAACEVIDQVYRNNSVHQVSVPGNQGAGIVGSLGARLLVGRGCDNGPSPLLWFNPATRTVRYLFHQTGNTEGVQIVKPYGNAGGY
jgi:hypothetical protein